MYNGEHDRPYDPFKSGTVEQEDLREFNGCRVFRTCVEDCRQCLFRTLDDTPQWDEDGGYRSL